TVLERLGMARNPPANRDAMNYDMTFYVFVPPTYDAKVPHGIFVWMGVTGFPRDWLNVIAQHKLILVCANNRPGVAPHGAALDAVYNLTKLYNIDANRVYASGFSAGGAQATHMLRCFPEVFHGGLFVLGGYFYLSRPMGHGQREPTIEPAFPFWKGNLDQIKKSARIVILRGGNDKAWEASEGRSDFQALYLDGFTHFAYFEIPGQDHALPNVLWFEKGVVALEQNKATVPPDISPTRDPDPSPAQNAQAERIFATGLLHLEEEVPRGANKKVLEKIQASRRETAQTFFRQTTNQFPTTPAAAKARVWLKQLSIGSGSDNPPSPVTNPPPSPSARISP
ncbi:MAG TPA: hypothetical protein VFV81_06590, partial [Verrucomicrobiae bacterium]|nr:hypothetical protein [Verrucomicrobiae bacterium]